MSTYPPKAANNIYCQCRKTAAVFNEKLKSREGAAELLGYSVSSLAGWELGKEIPSPEAVMRMAELYQEPKLKNHFCRNICPLGSAIPELKVRELDRIAIMALSAFRELYQSREKLLDIVADGEVTEEEKPMLRKIICNLDEVTDISQSLKAWAEKNM